MEKKNRDVSVDILRGMGIVIMILGHIKIGLEPYDAIFSKWYHAFHMPMFYVVSGYFFNTTCEEGHRFIYKKAKSLLVPYIFWGLAHIIFSFIIRGESTVLLSELTKMLTYCTINCLAISGALWFLPCLFWINVIYYYLNREIKNNWIRTMVIVLIGICGMEATSHGRYLPLALDAALVGLPFMEMGVYLKKISKTDFKKYVFHIDWKVLVILIGVVTASIMFVPEVNFRTGVYGLYVMTYVNAVLAAIILWNIARWINEKGQNRAVLKRVSTVISSIGKESIVYVCLNQWLIRYIAPAYEMKNHHVILHFAAMMLTLASVCFVCHVVMCVFSENKYLKKFVGK